MSANAEMDAWVVITYLDGEQAGIRVFDLEGNDPVKLAIGFVLAETEAPYSAVGSMAVEHRGRSVVAVYDNVKVVVSRTFRFAVNEGFGKTLDGIIDKIADRVEAHKPRQRLHPCSGLPDLDRRHRNLDEGNGAQRRPAALELAYDAGDVIPG